MLRTCKIQGPVPESPISAYPGLKFGPLFVFTYLPMHCPEVTAEITLPLQSCIPERAGYVDTQLSLLCAFLPSLALRTTNRHAICFLCCLKCVSKWIRGYAVTII